MRISDRQIELIVWGMGVAIPIGVVAAFFFEALWPVFISVACLIIIAAG